MLRNMTSEREEKDTIICGGGEGNKVVNLKGKKEESDRSFLRGKMRKIRSKVVPNKVLLLATSLVQQLLK